MSFRLASPASSTVVRGAGQSVVALVATAVVARWLFAFVLFPTLLHRLGTHGSQRYFDSYRDLAVQLLQGNGYRVAPGAIPTLNRPPGYVLVLLASFPGSDSGFLWFQFWHGLLGGLAVWLTVRMAREWGLSPAGAHFAGYAVALWPFLIWVTKMTVPENLLVALVPGVFWALGRWKGEGRWRWLLLGGLLSGWAALTHGLYQVFVIAVLATVLLVRRPWRERLAAVGVITICYGVVVGPWAVRNARIAGYAVGAATGFGYHYFKGLYTWEMLRSGGAYFHDRDAAAERSVAAILATAGFRADERRSPRSDPAINRFLDERARADILARPGAFALRALVRAPLLWLQQNTALRSAATGLLLAPFALLAVAGLWPAWDREHLGLGLALVTVTLVTAGIFPEARPMRYALPLTPLLFFFSARGYERVAGSSVAGEPRHRGGRA